MYKIPEKAVFLIDGSALLYRSYYGLRPLHTAKGVPTQATYGFCRSIKKLIDDFDAHEILVVWDSKGKTFRADIYKDYKATRQAPPSDLFIQKEHIVSFLEMVGIKQISQVGYEADDLIAGFIHEHPKMPIVIVGPDKDLYQLLNEHVVVLDPFKKDVLDTEEFKKKFGFEPSKLRFFYSLVGDASDNIPGVAGVGKKSAEELAKQFDDLDDLYKNLDKVKSERVKKALQEHKDDAFLSHKLFTLHPHKVGLSKEDIKFDKANFAKAASLFAELEFKSLLQEVGVAESQLSIVPHSGEKTLKTRPWKCHIIQTMDKLKDLVEEIKKKKVFAFDVETTGVKPLQDLLIGVSFAYNEKDAYYVPLGHIGEDEKPIVQIPMQDFLDTVRPIFESSTIKKYVQNGKFDELSLWNLGVNTNGIEFDSLLAANLLRQEYQKIGLKTLSVQYLNEPMQTFKSVMGKLKSFAYVPLVDAAQYGAYDSLQTFKLCVLLKKELAKEKTLEHIFKTVEMPLSEVLFDIESKGILLDVDKVNKLTEVLKIELEKIEHKIEGAIEHKRHHTINLNSPKQIEKLLFDDLKLPSGRVSSKGQRSTDHDVLVELSKLHPVPGLILQYREVYKMLSTYLEPLPQEVNPKTGRIHTTYSQTLVVTGRLSSSDPNLQNIPATKDLGIKIREAFYAPRGYQFISADYSQSELRILAYLSKDKTLMDIFAHNKDVHTETASQLFGIPIDKVTHDQRQLGKRINFSIIYGMTPFGLSQDLGIKPGEAKAYIEKYFEQYPGVLAWMEKTVEKATKDGYVETWMGRRRYIPGLREQNKNLYQAAYRTAINTPVQGTQAELMKCAMINLSKEFEHSKLDASMILQIHDELVFEVASDEVNKAEKIIEKTMESVVDWSVPFKVTLRVGKNWGDVTK